MYENESFESIKIGLASPEMIRSWSYGEVKKPETINYRTLKPEKEGLFCERIFGPIKDWECHCGKYKRIRYKGVVCDRCGVEVTKAKVRRERMGHIELACPCSHIWYFKGIPSRMGLILDISPRALEKVLYFASYIVLDPGNTPLLKQDLLTEKEYQEMQEEYPNQFRAAMGAEAIKELLEEIDPAKISAELKKELEDATGQKRIRLIRRLEVVEAFRISGNRPEWMILDALPVIPPDLRPMVELDGGRFATSDLNDLYRRVINRNNRLKRLLELGAPEIIVRNEKRMLQESVDALIDNGRRGRAVTGAGNRPLKSLNDMLKGKQGRFRQNLLGKRVDYSGRSVIVVGPDLKFYQCGLPKNMALELFKPYVMHELVASKKAHNIKNAKRMIDRMEPEVWDELEKVIKDHPVLLNRAPTLHRLGIQAFEPILVEGKAIKLHPLVCTPYNADFDGDQMAVHVPLSVEAQAEARLLMLSTNNILAPKDGKPITVPSQDMVLGCYYLTMDATYEQEEVHSFVDMDEVMLALQTKQIRLQDRAKVRVKGLDGTVKLIESTVGRFIFNQKIPQDLGFVDRENDKHSLEIDKTVDKKMLGKIIEACFAKYGNNITAELLDNIKSMGYYYSTIGAISISMKDVVVPDNKQELLDKAQKEVDKYEKAFRKGLISEEERYEHVIDIWNDATDEVTDALMDSLDHDNNIYIMATSGARGSKNQIRQLGGMRGLMASSTGKTVEIPIKSNFREGLSVLEFFLSSHGSRKGLSDTALKTADSGYLTRRLVDVSQDVIVREEDCGSTEYLEISAFKDGNEVIEELKDRLEGRYPFEDIVNPETGEVICSTDEIISEQMAAKIQALGIEKVKVRSVLHCNAKHGVCRKCYGKNLANGKKVDIGEAVGIIAAQSIGEPGTQLTMRTFHTGGVAKAEDITQGLPRVEELFEARKPKGVAVITEIDGKVTIVESDKKREVVVENDEETAIYPIVFGARIKVKNGDEIKAGDPLTEGSINPHDIFKVKGVQGVESYIVKEVQRAYRMSGVDINDKHVEIIMRQMLSKIRVEDSGDSDFIPGTLVGLSDYRTVNKELEDAGKIPATGSRVLLGITKAALATDSFLSAASFQETTRILADAAIKGKEDHLLGLKENVIIGMTIPAGTGVKRYINIDVPLDDEDPLRKRMEEKPLVEKEEPEILGDLPMNEILKELQRQENEGI